MKYKVGDKVRIKSLDWYNENKNNRNEITFENNSHWRFVANQSDYCGQIATITAVSETAYRLEQIPWNWTDEMIEGLVEDESNTDFIIKITDIDGKIEVVIPDGYGYEIENDKLCFVKKKKKYQKTYEECCDVLDIKYGMTIDLPLSYTPIIYKFTQLLICRDAYWKIAGIEIGLGKSWEPEYKTLVDNTYFTIHAFNGEIVNRATSHRNAILAFPAEEMRDIFYENFKDLIESCKELL